MQEITYLTELELGKNPFICNTPDSFTEEVAITCQQDAICQTFYILFPDVQQNSPST